MDAPPQAQGSRQTQQEEQQRQQQQQQRNRRKINPDEDCLSCDLMALGVSGMVTAWAFSSGRNRVTPFTHKPVVSPGTSLCHFNYCSTYTNILLTIGWMYAVGTLVFGGVFIPSLYRVLPPHITGRPRRLPASPSNTTK